MLSNALPGYAAFLNIGFGSMVSVPRVVAIISPDSAPVKRLVQDARDGGRVVDATYGRRTRAVLVMDSGHVMLSALQPETLAARVSGKGAADAPEATEDEAR